MPATELSKRLTKIREEHGYKRTELAEALEMPYRTVTNYETGEREPGHSYIIKIAKLFNVTTDYILGLENETSSPEQEEPERSELVSKDELVNFFKSVGIENPKSSRQDLEFLDAVASLVKSVVRQIAKQRKYFLWVIG